MSASARRKIVDMHAEIETITSDRDTWKARYEFSIQERVKLDRRCESITAERDALAQENKRLVYALRTIADLRNLGHIEPEVIAFEALATVKEPSLICPRCKVDRIKAPCPDGSLNCPMVGYATVKEKS